MKIVIMTIPLRNATGGTPFGSLAIIQSLREAGYDPYFLDVDTLRHTFPEVVGFFEQYKPDVIGISAVVSTSYAYTRDISHALRKILPNVRIVIGGNLCASAEVLLRSCQVDACVLAEGEYIIRDLLAYYALHSRILENYTALKGIKGLVFLDEDGEVFNTGYARQLSPEEIRTPDMSIIEEFSNIEKIISPKPCGFITSDPRSLEPHRAGKREGIVFASKGCINRCTFCHRWDKGMRTLSPEKVLEQISYLQQHHNVGFFRFADECFGAHKKKTAELVAELKKLDILWTVGGVRVDTVDTETLQTWKDAGCTAVNYGIESGSPTILVQMEKNISLEQNFRGIDDLANTGLDSVLQLVIGMPAESPDTIKETGRLIHYFINKTRRAVVSINFAQALPGTPLYEYDRAIGLIGHGWREEEAYLIRVFNKNAADHSALTNHTQYSLISLRCWMYLLYQEVERAKKLYLGAPQVPTGCALFYAIWLHSSGAVVRLVKRALKPVAPEFIAAAEIPFNEADIGRSPLLYPFRAYLNFLIVLRDLYRLEGAAKTLGHLWEHIGKSFHGLLREQQPAIDLRKTVGGISQLPSSRSEASMEPLRRGR
ncbi:MAG: radical SAM protein [Humidesulfovibrio sp.]|uniref:B12-binding domain-containing radical SAM protein n=1 Tax=Humidesulfovibrio sp. TaxID=2910988 RepID=UPI0027E8D9B0|nr:radical SAM protein [Humidesulfovibrio sp.]MDQ7834269.1 radical SAM protein [Humidesulfovibrio sp.]